MPNLTRDERKVFIFLSVIFLLGVGVNFIVKSFTPGKSPAYFSDKIGRINLNTADKDLLMEIPGIGEKLSQRILESRKARGNFSNIDELKEIKGISEAKFMKIRDYLILE
jgi:competence ComEA-like helix-hairpin-helix protein